MVYNHQKKAFYGTRNKELHRLFEKIIEMSTI